MLSQRSSTSLQWFLLVSLWLVACLAGCNRAPTPAETIEIADSPTTPPGVATPLTSLPNSGIPTSDQAYLFYLHGKIIEDQGLPAISPDFGEYQYEAILDKFKRYGFTVVSEVRPVNTDGVAYARKIAAQVTDLLHTGVPPGEITIVGASKGAAITVFISYFLANPDINFVLLSICNPDEVQRLLTEGIHLYGNVLSIYDRGDPLAGSCQDLFQFSEGRGLSRYAEIELQMGLSHGILYQPMDEWVLPVVQWTRQELP